MGSVAWVNRQSDRDRDRDREMDSFKLGTRKGVELLGTVLTIGSMAG